MCPLIKFDSSFIVLFNIKDKCGKRMKNSKARILPKKHVRVGCPTPTKLTETTCGNMANANLTLAYSTQSIFHRLELGVALGFAFGPWGFALGPQGFLDTNMLVSATRKSHVGGIAQHEPPTQVVSRCSGI